MVSYLQALPKPRSQPNCEAGHYYLLNNYNPGYFGDGTVDTTDTFTIPPGADAQHRQRAADGKVSFTWYGEGWIQYDGQNPTDPTNVYCNICNPFQYQTSIMTNQAVREQVLQGHHRLLQRHASTAAAGGVVRQAGRLNDGHPASSKFNMFEAFVRKIV